jgi:hypothetical protein
MKKNWPIILLILTWVNLAFSSNFNELDTVSLPKRIIDSLVLSDKLDWSVRAVSNFKEQRFKISNSNESVKYIPSNPFGVGFGIANQKIVIDIVFNIKNNKDDQTKKFAAEGGFMLKKRNFFSFILENVHGYKITNSYNEFEEFREDISLLSVGLNYLRIINKSNISVRDMKSGIFSYDKTTFTVGLGGFFIANNLNADGTIIPNDMFPIFNEEGQIEKIDAFGIGVLGGLSAYISLPANFYTSFYVAPGIGIEYKYIHTETIDYKPSNPLLYKTDLFASIGYVQKKFYINFNFGTNLYFTSFDFDNHGILSVTKSKFIVGYNLEKLGKTKKLF